MNERWRAVIAATDLPGDGRHKAVIDGWHVLIIKTDDGLFAINDRCSHQAALLSTGRVRRGAVMCALHGARFEVATGKCIGGAYRDLRTFALREVEGMIEVEIPAKVPGLDELPVVF